MEILKQVLEKSPQKLETLLELLDASIDGTRDIFVNRPLDMSNIRYIGFDMDYTLAIYKKREIEALAFNKTLEKLVETKGYPKLILDLPYADDQVIRGLLIDSQKGNLLKINRFKQVTRVQHGSQTLHKSVYQNERINQSDMQRFASVDTLFSLPEAYLFTLLVDLKEKQALQEVTFHEIYTDIRECIDMTHKDGSLKSEIIKDLDRYILDDPHLSMTLDKFIENGKKLFLLTNSEYYYTEIVMEHLLDTETLGYKSWRDYFEIILVNGRKPSFFTKETPFYLIDEVTGEEVKEPMSETSFDSNAVYSRGNYLTFEKLIQANGQEIAYIGDHIFGDVMRSDKDSNWRTVLVVQELEDELAVTEKFMEKSSKMRKMINKRDRLYYEIHVYSGQLNSINSLKQSIDNFTVNEEKVINQTRNELESQINHCQKELSKIHSKVTVLREEVSDAYHPIWGPLFHEKDEISRFGDQVRGYASLYTSRVSNFFFHPTDRYFKSYSDMMPHDRWLEFSS